MLFKHYIYIIFLSGLILIPLAIFVSLSYTCSKIEYCLVPLNEPNESCLNESGMYSYKCCDGFTCNSEHLYSVINDNSCCHYGEVCQCCKFINNPTFPLICILGWTFGGIIALILCLAIISLIRRKWNKYHRILPDTQYHQQL